MSARCGSLANHATPSPDDFEDVVYKLLDLMRFVIINHVHPYSGLPTDPDKLVQDLRDFDLDSILNKNIRLS
jgi:hypothetical protein